MPVSIILIEPKTSGNIGAIARVAKNFGYSEIVLIEPKCSIDEDAKKRAMHASDVLENAKIKTKKYLGTYDLLIGTTAQVGSNYNVSRAPLTPKDVARRIHSSKYVNKKKIGIVFGREDDGLHNDEIEMCQMIMKIPTSSKYPTMNLSHSVAIVLYEIFLAQANIRKEKPLDIVYPTKKEYDILFKRLCKDIKMLGIRDEKAETQKKVWKRIFAKAILTKRELVTIHGFLKKVEEK